jgi:hypothetical protein
VQRGIVVLGPDTRILAEFQNDALQMFYILDIVNSARARVDIGGPLVIDLPSGAAGASPLEGSSPQATINGDRVTVTGPFAPGSTMVQIGFTLRNVGKSYRLEQRFPVALPQVTMAVQKVGDLAMTSAQFETSRDVKSEGGTTFILGNGPALAAGTPFVVELTGLPAHSTVPRYATLGIALVILIVGGWLAFAGGSQDREARQRLIARRDTLLGELAQLEERRRMGGESLKQSARRNRILSELEQIYGELDESSAGPGGGGEGVAA